MEVTRRFRKISTGLGALALMMALILALASPAQAQDYSFTKVADSTADDFEPFSFGCATINARGTSPSGPGAWPRTGSTPSPASTG